MAYSTQRAVSNGTMTYLDLSIGYQSRADIKVFFNGLPAAAGSWAWVGTTDKRISFTSAVPNGTEVLVQRTTRLDRIINLFAMGAKFNNSTMDQNFQQMLYLTQEAVEGSALSDIYNDVDFHGYKVKNLGTATLDNEAVTFGQVKTMGTSAYAAQLAAQAAQTAAEAARDTANKWATQLTTPVSGSDYSAKQYALNAGSSASAASSSAGAAAGSATTAGTARDAAQAAQAAAEDARDDAVAAGAPATALIARVDAVEVVANNASTTAGTANTNASAALALAQFGPIGQCYLSSNGTQLRLRRKNGKYLMINGVPQVVPSGDILLTPTAVLNTYYYVYAYMNGANMALEISTTGHSRDTSTGVEIKTGDATRTLVGAFYCMTTNSTAPTGTAINVISWFQRQRLSATVQNAAVTLTTSTSEIATGNRIVFVCWADDYIRHRISGYGSVSVAATATVGHTFDGTNVSGGSVAIFGSTGGAGVNLSCDTEVAGTEGIGHYFNMYGFTNAGTCTMGTGWQSSVNLMG